MTKCDAANLSGTEKLFGDALDEELIAYLPKLVSQVDLKIVGAKQYFPGRKSGRLDAYDPQTGSAWEYKVVRLPRNQHDALWDIGQIAADYLRLHNATRLNNGYLIILLYGPLIEDAVRPSDIYRYFHDQFFLDRERCLHEGKFANDEQRNKALCEMTFDVPAEGKPDWVEVVTHRRLAALIYDCR